MPATSQKSVNSLSGPDTAAAYSAAPTQGIATLSSASDNDNAAQQRASVSFATTLSGADESIVSASTSATSGATSSASLSSSSDANIGNVITGVASESLFIEWGWDTASPYYFLYSMPEVVMHLYLDRAINMSALSKPENDEGPGTNPTYNAEVGQQDMLYDPSWQHGLDLAMLKRLAPKMVKDMAFWWGPPQDLYVAWVKQTLIWDIAYIHAFDPEIICQATVSENIAYDNIPSYGNWAGNRVTVPNELIPMFYGSAPRIVTPGNNEGAPFDVTYFDFVLMRYQYDTARWGPTGYPQGVSYYDPTVAIPGTGPGTGVAAQYQNEYNPDITQPETQMWYYYIATMFINAGCEAVHMGDIFLYCKADTASGYASYWSLLQKIRAYAATHARRGVVLLDAHCYDNYNSPWDPVYFDPGTTPVDNWQRQLLHDYQTLGIYFTRGPLNDCWNGPNWFFGETVPDTYHANQPVTIEPYTGLVNISSPGLNPQGWYCAHSPYQLGYDNGGIPAGAGCGYEVIPVPDAWGYDGSSWFVNQEDSLKTRIIQYCYYRLKCLDPYGHFQMPGRVINYLDAGAEQVYDTQTNTSLVNTIQDIWGGVFASPQGWEYHNFIAENVSHGAYNTASSLIFVGSDKMYFIGSDGWVDGFVMISGPFNDGNWVSVSPSAAAGGSQVSPLSSLVASPDGSMLLYIGVDGRVHGFEIIDIWTYRYFDFPYDPAIKADSCLIFPKNDRAYYIGVNIALNTRQVHGFQNSTGTWQTVSPTYAAGTYWPVSEQFQAAGGLTYFYGTDFDEIFYRSATGLLAYFTVNPDLWEYRYYDFEGNDLLSGNGIQVVGNLAIDSTGSGTLIYFAGHRSSDGGARIFVLGYNAGAMGWGIESLSNNANVPESAQQFARIDGLIAISPSADILAYTGTDNNIYLFSLGSWPFIYQGAISANDPENITNSLQFKTEIDIYGVWGPYLQHYKYQEAYCLNPAVQMAPTPVSPGYPYPFPPSP